MDLRASNRSNAERPDAVLCDLVMPVMNGLEFATRMRSDPHYRKVLLLAITGRASQADILETWRAGFDGHLMKPLTPEVLEGVVGRLTRPGFRPARND